MVKLKQDTHLVIKADDAKAYLTHHELCELMSLIARIEEGRELDGKKSNTYYVCNLDEPYADMVQRVILTGEDVKDLKNQVQSMQARMCDVNHQPGTYFHNNEG